VPADTTDLNPPTRILMGPGPSNVHPRVLRAMATPLVGHLDPSFLEIMDETKEMLQQLFQTSNDLTIPISATGSAGMEACLCNLIEPGDEVLVCVNGVFGERMSDIVERSGGLLVPARAEMGKIVEPDVVARALDNSRPKLIALVHAETSTGVLQPLSHISPRGGTRCPVRAASPQPRGACGGHRGHGAVDAGGGGAPAVDAERRARAGGS